MNQTKLESLIEQFLNVGSGFFTALIVWTFVVAPIWGIEVTVMDNLGITGIFTVVSVIRGYFWRRFFNDGIHKVVGRWIKDYRLLGEMR